jgi:5-amino-6-(5-phospho-D-ribitylamino)uracil phosphatase
LDYNLKALHGLALTLVKPKVKLSWVVRIASRSALFSPHYPNGQPSKLAVIFCAFLLTSHSSPRAAFPSFFMKFKMVAVDIDGTLLDSRGELPAENAWAVRSTVERGIKVILVTGRRYGTALRVAESLGLHFPMIVHNGALVKSPQPSERLANWFLSPQIASEILEATIPFLSYTVLHTDKSLQGQMVVHRQCRGNQLLQSYLGKMPESVLEVERLENAVDPDLIQVMFSGVLPAMLEVESCLNRLGLLENVKLAKTYYVDKNLGIVDILHKDCSKRHALEFLTGFYGCLPEEVLAIGDNFNDLEMLEYAGVGVIVANCVEALKGRGFVETSSNNDLGVAKALQKFVLRGF